MLFDLKFQGKRLAPQVGLEPTTLRLTVAQPAVFTLPATVLNYAVLLPRMPRMLAPNTESVSYAEVVIVTLSILFCAGLMNNGNRTNTLISNLTH